MTLHTEREGVAGMLGHDLTLDVGSWTADVTVGTDLADSSVIATIDLTSLSVVSGTGGAKPLSDKDRRDIEKNAGKSLEVGRHPTATFTSESASGSWENATVRGTLQLHGQSHPQEVLVTHGPDGFTLTGTIVQSLYGIKPYSAMLGALKLADPVGLKVTAQLT